MPTEREIAAMRAANPFDPNLPDRDLGSPVTIYFSAAERQALAAATARENYVYLSAYGRAAIVSRLRQGGYL